MTTNDYFDAVLDRITLHLEDEERAFIEEKQNALRQALREKLPLKTDFLTGSYRRHTIIKPIKDGEKFDVDIFVAFDNEEYGEKELADLRQMVVVALQQIKEEDTDLGITFVDDKQRRSVCVEFGKNFSIDVVPAVEVNENKLYKIFDKDTLKAIKSNPKLHAEILSEANKKTGERLIPIIKALKSWKRDKCDYAKSFHIELLAVTILGDDEIVSYAEGLSKFFSEVQAYLTEACLTDPANSEHYIDEYLDDDNTRQQLLDLLATESEFAAQAMELENSGDDSAWEEWQKIFGIVSQENRALTVGNSSQSLSLGDVSHRQRLEDAYIIDSRRYVLPVKIVAGLYWGKPTDKVNSLRYKGPFRSRTVLPPLHWLKYQVVANLQSYHDVYWQVVNTGDHASSKGGLRGQIELGEPTHWERSLYTGIHWIECFIVDSRTNTCVGRSDPFYVLFINPDFPPPRTRRISSPLPSGGRSLS